MSDDKTNGAGASALWGGALLQAKAASEDVPEDLVLVVKRPFEIETASGRKFIIHAASEEAARVAFRQAAARGEAAYHKTINGGSKPLAEMGAVVSVRLEPPVKTTLQEGPMTRDKK